MEKLFAQGTREKWRFSTPVGNATIEDLWDLPLLMGKNKRNTTPCLDDIAKAVNQELKLSSEESFVTENTGKNKLEQSKLDLVKYIIKVKIAERDAKTEAVAKKARKERILEIIASKEDEGLRENSIDDLKKELAGL